MLDDAPLVNVTDLKQYTYCPRVVFFERCLPHIRPRTYKMDAGKSAHEDEKEKAARRVVTRFDVADGERRFNLRLISSRFDLWGILDEVILPPDGTAIPVDYKLAMETATNHRVQLAAYALLLEEAGYLVERGYIYLIPVRKLVSVAITEALKDKVVVVLEEMRAMIAAERMPPPVTRKNQCLACEFRRFCNDV